MGNLVPAAQPDGTGHTGQAFDLLSRPTLPLINIIVNIFIIAPPRRPCHCPGLGKRQNLGLNTEFLSDANGKQFVGRRLKLLEADDKYFVECVLGGCSSLIQTRSIHL